MAFKFKTKKRPTAAQAFAGGFAQGVSSGIQQAAQLSLQDRLKKQEEEKNRLKRELDLFNGMVSNVEQTQANREAILRGKRMIIGTDGKTKASSAFAAISPEFTFTPSKEEEARITKQIESAEKKAMATAKMEFDPTTDTFKDSGMIGRFDPKLEVEQRKQEARIRLGLKPIYKEEEQEGDFLNTYNVFADGSRKLLSSKSKPVKPKEKKVVRKEEVREGLDQVFYNYYEDGSKVETKRQIGKYQEDDPLMGIPESVDKADSVETTTTVIDRIPPTTISLTDVLTKGISINAGDVISDPIFGQLEFIGGDSSQLDNYKPVNVPKK
jgi:hypothetical protein